VNTDETNIQVKAARKLSLDTWAVLIALAAAVLIRVGLVHVGW
jgi:hypothetical protein